MGGGGKGGGSDNTGNLIMGIAAMQAADKQYQLGMEQLNWAKQTYNEFKPYMIEGTEQALADQKWSSQTARDQYQFYTDTYKPLEKEYVQQVEGWDTPERREQMAGQAQSAVSSQFEQARNAAAQQLESFGVDPSSTRYAALDLGSRTQQAAAAAGAGTKAIQDTENMGLGLKGQAINTGRGYQQNVNQTIGTGSSAGSAGTSGLSNFFGTSSNAMTAPVAWFNAGNTAQGNAITAFNNYTNNGIKQQQANQQGAQGMMQGISGLMNSVMSLEDGGAIPQTIDAVRGDDGSWALPQDGGHVPAGADPYNGAIPDGVNARLSEGEFVIPRDVVEWEGQKSIYKMIDKAKQERAGVEASTETKPSALPPLPGPPRFVSQSGGSAIPA